MPELGRVECQHAERDERSQSLCQGRLCDSGVHIQKNIAVKICHHEDCQDNNKGSPLLLCLKCDEEHHLGSTSTHARFDIPGNGGLNRSPSSQSLGSDSGAEDDVDGENLKPDKKTRGYSSGKRMFKLTSGVKKKPRRHNIDGPGREFITLQFHHAKSEEYEAEMVQALKGKSLKDSLEPLFTARSLSFETHSVFLDASHTPLPLAFDTFPLGGNVLHVRANADVKIDKRVIDMVRNIEDKDAVKQQPAEDPAVRKTSFMRTGSFTTIKAPRPDEKEKEQILEKLTAQQLKNSQRGKKNIMSFLGDDPTSGYYSSVSSPVLSGGFHASHSNVGSLARPKSANRLTGLFNQPKQSREGPPKGVDGLKDILDRYEIYGLEDTEIDDIGSTNDEMKLEDTWTEVVSDQYIKVMNKKEKDLQEAIWELLATEVTYLRKLRVFKKLYILCLRNLQSEGFLQDVIMERLFSNIEEIYEVNLSFWLDCLSQVVINSRRTHEALNPLDMADGFPMFETRFEPYIKYCLEESKCLKYLKEKLQEDENFRTYKAWCEEHRLCTDRLKLNDLLVKPMQRVTKYPLLLKAIHKKTQDETTKTQVMRMILRVQSFLSKVNGAMKIRHEEEKLKKISDRILVDSYCSVEPVNEEMEKVLTDYSSLDLMGPMPGVGPGEHRCILQEGSLRLVEKQGKMDVYVFLFTDVMLITKPKKGDKYRVLKPPLPVDKLVVHPSKDPGMFLLIYLNEYNTVVQGFALQGTVTDQQNWTDTIKKAQKMYAVAQIGRGSGNVFQTRYNSDSSELASPSTAMLIKFPSDSRRFSNSSIISLDSDSENGSSFGEPVRPHTLPRYKSETALMHSESTRSDGQLVRQSQGWRKGRVTKRRSSLTDLKLGLGKDVSLSTVSDSEDKNTTETEIEEEKSRTREDTLKIFRSSSAPLKPRPRPEVAVTRSSSEPQGPKPIVKRIPRELPVINKRHSSDGSVTSSSLSLDDSAVESATESMSSLQTSTEFSCSPIRERLCSEAQGEEETLAGSEPCVLAMHSDSHNTETEEPSETSDVSETVVAVPQSPVVQPDSEELTPLPVASDETDGPEVFPPPSQKDYQVLSKRTSRLADSPGILALQSLSESLESSLKPYGVGKQTPHIRSPLIAQQKIQSAISASNVAPVESRKRSTSLPRRSSPVASRKPRPASLVRGSSKSNSESSESADKSPVTPDSPRKSIEQLFEQNATAPMVNREQMSKLKPPSKLSKRYSDPVNSGSRVPVKPDRSHYPVGREIAESDKESDNEPASARSANQEDDLETGPRSAPPTSKTTRKKSVSLMDLLNFGRELTNSRDKSKGKENETNGDKQSSSDDVAINAAEANSGSRGRLAGCSDGDNGDDKQAHKNRFRLRRSRSRNELKDGIASGPNIDKRKATKLFLKESLLLESSSCDSCDSYDSGSCESIPEVVS